MDGHYVQLGGGMPEKIKIENPSEYSSSAAFGFVTTVVKIPETGEYKQLIKFILLRIFFFSYLMFFVVFGAVEFAYRFKDFFWLLHVTMMVKIVVLSVSLRKIELRLKCQPCLVFLHLMDESIPSARSYALTTAVCNTAVMAFYYGVWYSEFTSGALNLFLVGIFFTGTMTYLVFSAVVLIISITDARVSRSSVENLILSSKRGLITSASYSSTRESIQQTVDDAYYVSGTLLICMLSNTVAAIVLMLMFKTITDGENSLRVFSFTVYVLVVQWATDVVFLFFLLPEISDVNESAHQLHVVTASQRWVDEADGYRSTMDDMELSRSTFGSSTQSIHVLSTMEANRYDTLHRIIAQPIRYTIASIFYTKAQARNQLLGIFGAVFLSFLRVLVSLALD